MLTRSGFLKALLGLAAVAVTGAQAKPKPPVVYYTSRALGKSLSVGQRFNHPYGIRSLNYVIQSQAADEMFTQMMLSRQHEGKHALGSSGRRQRVLR